MCPYYIINSKNLDCEFKILKKQHMTKEIKVICSEKDCNVNVMTWDI